MKGQIMKTLSAVLFSCSLLLLVACGQGKEVVDEGTDDQVDTAATSESSASTATQAAAPVVSADAATINGTVKFEGAAPAAPVIQMGADAYCQSQHPTPVKDEEAVVGPAGELANVIVWVKDVQGNFPAPSTAALVDQKGCQYIPHVTAVQAGQPIEIRNSDSTMHNVHAMPKDNSPFNLGQPVAGTTATKRFDKVEPVQF
ncbi:MAG TPA: hypothetical protein VN181_13225, partial [Thermoanaerobaculia bacterium]|nr:hypothetical protein [Thermoanaerobaculia bacterium]